MSPRPPDDGDDTLWNEWIERALAGDNAALTRLSAAMRRLALRYFLRTWPREAEDLAQACMVRVLKDDLRWLRGFDRERGMPFKLFFRRMLTWLSNDFARSPEVRRERRTEQIDDRHDTLPDKAAADDGLKEREVLENLEPLSPRERLITSLLVKELTRKEIARVLGISGAALDVAIHRMRKKRDDRGDDAA